MNSSAVNNTLRFNCHIRNDKVIILVLGQTESTSLFARHLKIVTDDQTKYAIHVTESLPLANDSPLHNMRIDQVVCVINMSLKKSLDIVQQSLSFMACEYFAGHQVSFVGLFDEFHKQTVTVGELANCAKTYQSPLFLTNVLQDDDLDKIAKQIWNTSKSSAGIDTSADCLNLHALGPKYFN